MASRVITKKQAELDKIAASIRVCRTCKKNKIGVAVPGEGNPNAHIVFLGEAPGKKEAETGRPFIGPAGKVLRGLLQDILVNTSDVYITSPVKYLPKYVTPTLEDIAHGKIHLLQQLAVIKPKIIVLMGATAGIAMLNDKYSIAKEHGRIIKRPEYTYFLSYHPAAQLYSPKLREVLKQDFQILRKFLDTHKKEE